MADKQIIMEDCVYFIGGNCQEYLDGVCENHKCDLKIIRELEQKLKAKEQECEELKNTLEEIQRIANSGQRSSDPFVRSLAETIFATASEVLDV